MKKITAIMIALLLPLTALLGCGGGTPSLSLSEKSVSMTLFGEKEIVATYENIADGINWKTSDDSVVKLEISGNAAKLIAVGSGTATVTVSGGELTDSCTVLVAATSERLSLTTNGYEQISLRKGGTIYVPATVTFAGESFEKAVLKYEMADTSVATVNEEGLVTGVKAGNTVLTVYAEYYGSVSNRINLNVEISDGPFIKVNTANLNLYTSTQSEDLPSRFELEVSFTDGENEYTDIDYVYENSDPSVAGLSDGVITGLKEGKTEITISYVYENVEYYSKIFVTVKKPPVVTLKLIDNSLSLYTSSPIASYIKSSQLVADASVDGKTISNDDLIWKVDSGSDVVSVSSTGLVKALKEGTAEVSVNYSFAGIDYSDVCKVSVYAPVGYVSSHHNWDRAGIFTTVFAGTQLEIDDLTLVNDKDSVFIRLNIVPDNPIVNTYGEGDKSPIAPDTRSQRNLRMFYITLTDLEDTSNSLTIAVRVYLEGDGFFAEVAGARIGVRASTFPNNWTPGGVGSSSFFGAFNGVVTDERSPMGISGGWGSTAAFSFFGAFLDDLTDKYSLGFSLEGTTVYMHNNNTVTKIWDLKEDTLAYAEAHGILSEENVWNGFTSDKVTVSIRGDYYDTSSFNLMITELEGNPVSETLAERFEIKSL